MAENTEIEWATHTWNPWLGCTKVSAGCKNCYAETLMDTRYGKVAWGQNGTRVRTTAAYWRKPIAWNAASQPAFCQPGDQTRVFPSLCDVFEDWGGPITAGGKNPVYLASDNRASRGPEGRITMDDCRTDLFRLIDATPHLTWLLLTKRPENILKMWPYRTIPEVEAGFESKMYPEYFRAMLPSVPGAMYRPNVWIGTSIENQETADQRIPELLKCRELSPVLWLSYEPALGPVDFRFCPGRHGFETQPESEDPISGLDADGRCNHSPVGMMTCSTRRHWTFADRPSQLNCGIDWTIIGGESGPGARTAHIDWYRSAVKQCNESDVAVFVKQLGASWYEDSQAGQRSRHSGIKSSKGGDPSEWPPDLRVRQYPEAKAVSP